MSSDHYARALQAALREYQQAIADRAALDTRIAHLQQTIGTLNRLCGYEPTVPMGLTEACRMVLRSAGRRLTAPEMRERLRSVGFDLGKYANALAAIHTVLKRMTEAGEIAPVEPDDASSAAYEMLDSGLIASRPGARKWPLRPVTGVGLCPPKDRPKLTRTAKTATPKRLPSK